jgi:hypothetical protein
VVDLFLNCAAGDEPEDGHGPPLADAPRTLTRLAVSAAASKQQRKRQQQQQAAAAPGGNVTTSELGHHTAGVTLKLHA